MLDDNLKDLGMFTLSKNTQVWVQVSVFNPWTELLIRQKPHSIKWLLSFRKF